MTHRKQDSQQLFPYLLVLLLFSGRSLLLNPPLLARGTFTSSQIVYPFLVVPIGDTLMASSYSNDIASPNPIFLITSRAISLNLSFPLTSSFPSPTQFYMYLLKIPYGNLIKESSMGDVRNRMNSLVDSTRYGCIIGFIDETSSKGHSNALVIERWGWKLKEDYADFAVYQRGKAYIVFLKSTLEEFIHSCLRDTDLEEIERVCKRRKSSIGQSESHLNTCPRVGKLKEVIGKIIERG